MLECSKLVHPSLLVTSIVALYYQEILGAYPLEIGTCKLKKLWL
jgi:hypothetical protein